MPGSRPCQSRMQGVSRPRPCQTSLLLLDCICFRATMHRSKSTCTCHFDEQCPCPMETRACPYYGRTCIAACLDACPHPHRRLRLRLACSTGAWPWRSKPSRVPSVSGGPQSDAPVRLPHPFPFRPSPPRRPFGGRCQREHSTGWRRTWRSYPAYTWSMQQDLKPLNLRC